MGLGPGKRWHSECRFGKLSVAPEEGNIEGAKDQKHLEGRRKNRNK